MGLRWPLDDHDLPTLPPFRGLMHSISSGSNGTRAASRRSRTSSARAVAAALFLLAAITPVYATAAEIVHVVAKGQTLGRIAKRYRVTVAALSEVNDLRPGERLHPGLSLVIPEKGKEREAAKKAASLRAGDTGDDRAPAHGRKGKAVRAGGKDDARAIVARGAGDRTYARKPRRPGLVHFVRGTEHADLQLLTRHGRLVPASLPAVGKMLRFAPTGARVPVDPRLVTLIGLVSDHFGGRPLDVVSGFRPYTPTQYTPHSNHNVGRAMDFNVEGVPNAVLRDFCKSFRNAGVGYYPNSSFVHLDAREGRVFWVDYSKAGESPSYESPREQTDADEAARDVAIESSDPHSGSSDTHQPVLQLPDDASGTSLAVDPAQEPARRQGQPDPTSSAPPHRAADHPPAPQDP